MFKYSEEWLDKIWGWYNKIRTWMLHSEVANRHICIQSRTNSLHLAASLVILTICLGVEWFAMTSTQVRTYVRSKSWPCVLTCHELQQQTLLVVRTFLNAVGWLSCVDAAPYNACVDVIRQQKLLLLLQQEQMQIVPKQFRAPGLIHVI